LRRNAGHLFVFRENPCHRRGVCKGRARQRAVRQAGTHQCPADAEGAQTQSKHARAGRARQGAHEKGSQLACCAAYSAGVSAPLACASFRSLMSFCRSATSGCSFLAFSSDGNLSRSLSVHPREGRVSVTHSSPTGHARGCCSSHQTYDAESAPALATTIRLRECCLDILRCLSMLSLLSLLSMLPRMLANF